MELRDYQQDCLDSIFKEIKKKNDALVVASTGAGKTAVFVKLVEKCSQMMSAAGRDFKAMVLVQKIDLVTQTRDRFNSFAKELDVGLYCGSLNEDETDSEVIIASIDSIKKEDILVNLLVVDEAHQFYSRKSYAVFVEKLRKINPKLKIVGFTATPYGKTGFIYGNEGDAIEKPCFTIGMKELVDRGYLLPVVFKGSEESFNTEGLKISGGDFLQKDIIALSDGIEKTKLQITNALKHLEGRKKIVWCCTCIDHAKSVEKILREFGEKALSVHSRLPVKRQFQFVDAFENGDFRHLTSVTKLSEGTDIPAIDAIVCLRPTRSPKLYVQMVGRGLRTYGDLKDCLFLDFGGVVEALGHPSNPYVKEKNTRKKKVNAIICPSCRELNFAPVKTCSCGYEFLKDEREIDRLQNLGLVPYDPKNKRKLSVLKWSIHWHFKAKSGRAMVLISYYTMKGVKRQYIPKLKGNKYYIEFVEDHKKGCPPYIEMDEKNKFVKRRVYA